MRAWVAALLVVCLALFIAVATKDHGHASSSRQAHELECSLCLFAAATPVGLDGPTLEPPRVERWTTPELCVAGRARELAAPRARGPPSA